MTHSHPVIDTEALRSAAAQAVAAFLGLGAVGVKDPDAHPGGVESEQAVGAEAPIAVAQQGQDRDQLVEVARQVTNQVVVPTRFELNEINSH